MLQKSKNKSTVNRKLFLKHLSHWFFSWFHGQLLDPANVHRQLKYFSFLKIYSTLATPAWFLMYYYRLKFSCKHNDFTSSYVRKFFTWGVKENLRVQKLWSTSFCSSKLWREVLLSLEFPVLSFKITRCSST